MATAVIGDIHGQREQLERLLEALPYWPDCFIFLGDYLDRGPDSRGVIDRLLQLAQEENCIFLRGNHEDLALDALEKTGRYAEGLWELNGGLATIQSYPPAHDRKSWRALLPPEHAHFLRETRLYYETSQHVFVHARINPEGPAKTPPHALLWERLASPLERIGYGKRVICGHTPFPEPMIGPDWINLDTGCGKWRGSSLSALLLPEGRFVYG